VSESDIFGQRYTAAGAPAGSEFLVNAATAGKQVLPDVAADAKGGFVTVWSTYAGGQGVFGRRFAADGQAVGAELTITTAAGQFARVAAAPGGEFVVVWYASTPPSSRRDVFARLYDRAGAPRGGPFVVGISTTVNHERPVAAFDGAGNFVVAWERYPDFSQRDVLTRRFDAAGTPIGGEILVNTYTTNDQGDPAIAMTRGGDFVVAWTSQGQDGSFEAIFARRFAASGVPLGGEFQVDSYTTDIQNQPDVAMDESGSFAVAWGSRIPDGSGYAVRGQRFDAQGVRRGAEFQVNSYTTGNQFIPSVASDTAGNLTLAWWSEGQDGSGAGVYAQRFGGLRPASLAMDPAGNSVLEPGETVSMRPSWTNANGAPQAFAGHLESFTGPAGATYTLTDADASYGTVANGATASCGADCYQVSVSDPATRPAAHWDTVARERIVPDVQGQAKDWTVHVGRSFSDMPPSSPFYRFAETMLHGGITAGCGPGLFCPAASTTRAQMAVFILLATEGPDYLPPACTTPVFNDVPASSPFCRWVEELARRGVVAGCGNGNFCPGNPVNREQMAVFIVRVREPNVIPPPCVPPNLYLDVPETSPFCRWIEALSNGQATGGCGGGNYCPLAILTREQMSVFITVIFGLSLYGP